MLLGDLLEGRAEPKQVKGESLSPMAFATIEVVEELLTHSDMGVHGVG